MLQPPCPATGTPLALVLTDPFLVTAEDPHALLLQVSDETEVGLSPYISAEEVARRVAESQRAAREAAANKDDAPQRALQDMMSGTLEAKDAVTVLRESLVRLPWMDAIPEEKYNAEQRGVMEERGRAAAALEALLERRKAELNAELVRLGGELREIGLGFDERLRALGRRRGAVASALASLELYRARLGESVCERGVGEGAVRRSGARAGELEEGARGALGAYEAHAALCEAAGAAYEAAAAADRALDKGFKTALLSHVTDELGAPAPSNAVLKVLGALYKKRPTAPSASLALAASGRALHAPSAAAEAAAARAAAAAREAALRDLTAADLPEGYETLGGEAFWPRFSALRRAKIESELAVAEAA